jgi:SAM-dependent methyltransferase
MGREEGAMERPRMAPGPDERAWVIRFPGPAVRHGEVRWGVDGKAAATFPDRLFHWESFAPPPQDNATPYTLQWFLAIEHQRYTRQARWLPALLNFTRHAGETLLGLGHSLGTDWLQYARHGARVIASTPVQAELALIRRNFELRHLPGRFLHADPAALPLADTSVDVAVVTNLLHELADPDRVVAEVFRVLKPGGKVVALVPAKYDVHFWKGWWRRTPPPVPTAPWRTPAAPADGPRTYSARRLQRLFHPFADHRIHKRHVRRRDFPWLCRVIPRPWLERWFGRFLLLQAFKPVHVTTLRAAA